VPPARPGSIWILAALQAAVTLSWMAYGYHQPRLLAHFGFETLSGVLAWYLALAGTTLAPLAGDASDRLVRSGGDRFPIVRAGVFLAGASFVAVAVTAAATADSPLRWVLPLFVAIWIAGMTVFHAPALAIVRDVSAPGEVSSAMVPVILATTVPIACWPLVGELLQSLGGSATFLSGGVAVVGTALALGRTHDVARDRPAHVTPEPPGALRAFACGIGSAVAVLLATGRVPAALADAGSGHASWLAALAMIVASVTAALAARAGGRIPSGPALVGGIVVALAGFAAARVGVGTGVAIVIAMVTGLGLGLHLGTALPFLLRRASSERAGLTTGLYVGGAMLGARLVHVLFA
jgi:hypothetical protein